MAIETDFDLWRSGWVVEGEDEWELLPGAPPDAVEVFKKLNRCCTDCILIIKEDKSIPEKNEEEKTAPEKNEEEKTAAKLFGFENKEQ